MCTAALEKPKTSPRQRVSVSCDALDIACAIYLEAGFLLERPCRDKRRRLAGHGELKGEHPIEKGPCLLVYLSYSGLHATVGLRCAAHCQRTFHISTGVCMHVDGEDNTSFPFDSGWVMESRDGNMTMTTRNSLGVCTLPVL